MPSSALSDSLVEQIPAGNPVLAELVDLLRSMLSVHGSEVPDPSDVITTVHRIRSMLYTQVQAQQRQQQAGAAAGIAGKFDKHTACVRACQAMASEFAGRGEQVKSRNAQQACNRHAGSLGRAARAYCPAMWTYFDTTKLDDKDLKSLLKHSDASLEVTGAVVESICRRNACPLTTIDSVPAAPVGDAPAPASDEAQYSAAADGTWASITALKGPVGSGGMFKATSFSKWSKQRTITIKQLAAVAPGGKPRLEVRWKADAAGAMDFDFTDKETAAGGCEQVKEAKWFAPSSLRDGCAGREHAGGMCVCIPLVSAPANGGAVTKRTLRVYIANLGDAEAFVAKVNAGVAAVRKLLP